MRRGLYQGLLSSVLAVGCILSPISVLAANKCQHIFRPQNIQIRFGLIKETFKHNNSYKVELGKQSEVINQCNLGTCHLHSWISSLERYSNQNHRKSIKISSHYLSAMHWLTKSLGALRSNSLDININLGAHVFASKDVIVRFGIMPDSAWTGARDFTKAPIANRITEYIRNVIARTKLKVDQEVLSDKKEEHIKEGERQIMRIFEDMIGSFESKFNYQGENYSPQSFMKTFFSDLAKPIVLLEVGQNRRAKNIIQGSELDNAVITTSIDQVEKSARELIDLGKSVELAYDHNGQYVDMKSGVMSISAFSFPKEAAPLTREQRSHFNLKTSAHAVQIVGYDIDPRSGRVLKWKIKNSWGSEVGDAGYFHMYNDYFRTFALSVSFANDSRVKLPEDLTRNPFQMGLPF